MKSDSKGPVVAAKFGDYTSASIAAGMLEDNGIPAHAVDSIMGTIYSAGYTWAPVSLYVRAEDLERARELLRQHGDI